MAELTPEAKALIADSIRIVREDKSDAWWRKKLEEWNGGKSKEEGKAPGDPPKDTPPSPPKNEEGKVDAEPKPKRKSAYWGVFDDEEDSE